MKNRHYMMSLLLGRLKAGLGSGTHCVRTRWGGVNRWMNVGKHPMALLILRLIVKA